MVPVNEERRKVAVVDTDEPAASVVSPEAVVACVVGGDDMVDWGPVGGVILEAFCADGSADVVDVLVACGRAAAVSNLVAVVSADGDDLLDDAPGLLGSSCLLNCADSCCCRDLLSSLPLPEDWGVFFFFKKLKICFAILKNFQQTGLDKILTGCRHWHTLCSKITLFLFFHFVALLCDCTGGYVANKWKKFSFGDLLFSLFEEIYLSLFITRFKSAIVILFCLFCV